MNRTDKFVIVESDRCLQTFAVSKLHAIVLRCNDFVTKIDFGEEKKKEGKIFFKLINKLYLLVNFYFVLKHASVSFFRPFPSFIFDRHFCF